MTSARQLALLAILAAAVLLAGCSLAEDVTPPSGIDNLQPVLPSGPVQTAAAPLQPPDVANGAAIYAEKCAACHGPSGLGDGAQASALPNPPAALGDPALARQITPADWYAEVTDGNLDRFMPGFQSLSDAERWDVVAYALTLSEVAQARPAAMEAFAAECAGCHGELGAGGETGPALNGLARMAENTLQQAYDVITQGAQAGMPAFGERLADAERWALAAYVRSLAFAAPVNSVAGQDIPTPSAAAAEVTPAATGAGMPPTAETTPAAPPTEAATPAASPEASAGFMHGQVVQGTTGIDLPAGLEVTLHAFDGQSEVLTDTQTVAADGAFTFDGLEPVVGRLFVVTTEVDGVVYGTETAHLPEVGGVSDLLLMVYATTPDTASVRVSRMHLLLNFSTEGVVEVIELWLVSNASDRTVVAAAGQGTLAVDLPAGALSLAFEQGTDPARFVQTGTGFFDTDPIRPGTMSSQVVFSFALPYDGRLDFVQPVGVPVEAAVALVPEGGPTLSGDGVQDQGARDMNGTSVHTYALSPAEAGGSVQLRMSGPPRAADQAGGPLSNIAIGVGALGVALIAAGLWWYRRPSLRRRQAESLASVADPRQELLRQLAALDESHQAGRIEETAYQDRRAALKQELLELMRGERG